MSRELLKQALEALEAMQAYAQAERKGLLICDNAITALREALAQPEQPAPGAVAGKKMQVTLQDSPVDVEIAQYKRMFESACVDLGLINEALGLDPDDGGAEPILEAIAALKAVIAQPEQEPVAYHYCFVNAFGHPVWDVGFNVPRASVEEHPLYRHTAPTPPAQPYHIVDVNKKVQPEQEPYGFFKPEPFGWTDCAETDEGAVPLYEKPVLMRQPLTDEEMDDFIPLGTTVALAEILQWMGRTVEAAHGIKGTA